MAISAIEQELIGKCLALKTLFTTNLCDLGS